MSKILKNILVVCIVMFSLLGILYYDFNEFCKRSVPIFAYHKVVGDNNLYSISPDIFEKQMQYLHEKGYTTISLSEYVNRREQGNDAFNKNCIITFDDGYANNNSAARPIMDKYGYKGTIFVAIKFMAWPGYVTWMDLWDLKTDGWEIGSHTYNHVSLNDCTPEQLRYEIKESKNFINNFDPGFKVNTMAYPFGSYNDDIGQVLKENNYIAAVTGIDGVNVADTPIYELYRVNIFNDSNNFKMFKKRLLWSQLSSWTRSHGLDITKLREILT